MLRVTGHFINLEDIFHAEFHVEEEVLHAEITLIRDGVSKVLSLTDGAEYLQTVLDATHATAIQKIRDEVPPL